MKQLKTYPVEVRECRATYDAITHGVLVCGNPFNIEFFFDEEWDETADLAKKAKIKFYHNGRYEHITIEFNGNVCPVPALFDITGIEVGVYIDGDICTTTGAVIPCNKSIRCGVSKSVLGADAIDNINKALKGENGKDGIDGNDGYTPQKGIDYFDGADGFSPIVAVEDIKGGHRVTITDKNGGKSFDVMNGTDGQGGAGGGVSFIDVLNELPTENIKTGMFYRLTTGVFAYEGNIQESNTIYCVTELPEVGEPVTDANQSAIVAYFNTNSGTIHGYIDGMLSAGLGIPSGWYGKELFDAFGVAYGGVITDVSESEGKNAFCVLIKQRMYFYDNGWCEAAFGYEKVPEFDITWDGEIGDRFALDMSLLGYKNTYFVKVSDRVFTTEELIGGTYTQNDGYKCLIDEYVFNAEQFTGAIVVDGGIVIVHSADELNAALGVPAGYITNGTYFVHMSYDGGTANFADRLVAPSKVTKIDSKFIKGDFDGYVTHEEFSNELYFYAKQSDVNNINTQIGNISAALDELHAYAHSKVNGGDA